MSVKYNVVARRNPQNPDAPPKYYPSVVSTDRKGLRELSDIMAEVSTVSPADAIASLEAMLIALPRALADGNIVELGDFGSFWIRFSGEGAEDEADVTSKNIKTVKPYFRPGKVFKKALEDIEFRKA